MSVFIAKENKHTKQAIRKIITHFKDNLDFSKGIFLKPNIVFPVREKSGEITRHAIVRALVHVLREIDPNVEIILGEGTAAGTVPAENFEVSGYTKLVRELNVELINLDTTERIKLKWKYGILKLPKMAFDKTYINLPILKPSSAAVISGAMKNQKGLLQPNMKKGFHKLGLHAPIAHMNKLVQPDLTIMDGINFFNENVLIAGDNTYEIDRLAVELLKAPEPAYLKMARKIGVGSDDFTTLGISKQDVKSTHKIQPAEYKHFLRIRLWSNPRACSMCRYVFLSIKKFSNQDFRYATLMKLKLFRYAITGAEIVFGSKPHFEARYKNTICIGNCTKKLAKQNDYIHIPGCPPTKEQMLKCLP